MVQESTQGVAVTKEEKSGRITLRMDPALHAELAELAHAAGMDLNGIINWLIRRALPEMEIQAFVVGKQRKQTPELWAEWRAANPTRPVIEFVEAAIQLQQGKAVECEDGSHIRREGKEYKRTKKGQR